MQNESRREHDKLTDPTVLADLMEQFNLFGTLPFEPTFQIDSTSMTPVEVAEQIAAHYALPLLDTSP